MPDGDSPFLAVPASEWLAANDSAFAIADRFPVSPGHALVVPRRVIATWWEATGDERAGMLALVDEFARPGQQIRWCARWWDHPEAVLRLDAMWRTWEAAALDPVRGIAVWIRDYLDPNLAVLFSPAGPFADCGDGQHVKPSVLPVSATPPVWWSASHWWEMLTDPDR
jgi:hypothetical protein